MRLMIHLLEVEYFTLFLYLNDIDVYGTTDTGSWILIYPAFCHEWARRHAAWLVKRTQPNGLLLLAMFFVVGLAQSLSAYCL